VSEHWRLTPGLEAFIKGLLKEVPSPGFAYYPCIGWTLGGLYGKVGAPQKALPPGYGLGLVRRTDLAKYMLTKSRLFGYVAFTPKAEDASSFRRLIDFDGKEIVVR
jgi:hypothetical protein